jgi:hypothetical protein
MKKHFLTMFDAAHRVVTTVLFLVSIAMIVAAVLIGTRDNPPGILVFFGGILFLFMAFLHPWRKWENYALLIGLCSFIILLTWMAIRFFVFLGKPSFVNEGVVMILILFFCVPGILVGIIGTLYWAFRKKKSRL